MNESSPRCPWCDVQVALKTVGTRAHETLYQCPRCSACFDDTEIALAMRGRAESAVMRAQACADDMVQSGESPSQWKKLVDDYLREALQDDARALQHARDLAAEGRL